MDLCLVLCNFIALRDHKIFVVSLFDPFFEDCIVLHQHPSTDSSGKLHDIHGNQGRLWCQKYCSGCDSYDQSVFDRVFSVIFPIKFSYLLYRFFHHQT